MRWWGAEEKELITEQSEGRCIYMYFSVISVTNVRKNNHRFEGIFKTYKKEERCSNKIISNQSRKLDSLRYKLSSPFQLELDAILLPDIYIKDILDNNSPKNFLKQICFLVSITKREATKHITEFKMFQVHRSLRRIMNLQEGK